MIHDESLLTCNKGRDVDDRRPGRLTDLVILVDVKIIVDRVENSSRNLQIIPIAGRTATRRNLWGPLGPFKDLFRALWGSYSSTA